MLPQLGSLKISMTRPHCLGVDLEQVLQLNSLLTKSRWADFVFGRSGGGN